MAQARHPSHQPIPRAGVVGSGARRAAASISRSTLNEWRNPDARKIQPRPGTPTP